MVLRQPELRGSPLSISRRSFGRSGSASVEAAAAAAGADPPEGPRLCISRRITEAATDGTMVWQWGIISGAWQEEH